MTEFFTGPQGRRLAYNRHRASESRLPGVVFLGGFKSDMTGSKAQYLQAWAEANDRSFLRFDYSGHGSSEGAFEEGAIGEWAEDALAVIEAQSGGPQILVGSSMGGWISLLTARRHPALVAGLVTIAAAPDFTSRTWEHELTEAMRAEVTAKGRIEIPSDYADQPYVFTRKLFEDGARQQVLDQPLPLPFPVRLLQGTADSDVPMSEALRLLAHIDSPDLRLTLVRDADHRFSTPDCLQMIVTAIEEITDRLAGQSRSE